MQLQLPFVTQMRPKMSLTISFGCGRCLVAQHKHSEAQPTLGNLLLYPTSKHALEMATWHNFSECSRLDLFESQRLSTCLNCGSLYVEPQPSEENPAWKQHPIESNEDGELDSTEDDEYGSQVESSDEEAGASKT